MHGRRSNASARPHRIMNLEKGSRHSKIIGELGEKMMCELLSRSGFKVSVVDHTGIDVMSYHSKSEKRIGITVKSRTRTAGTEDSNVIIFSNRRGENDKRKLLEGCKVFGCEP